MDKVVDEIFYYFLFGYILNFFFLEIIVLSKLLLV